MRLEKEKKKGEEEIDIEENLKRKFGKKKKNAIDTSYLVNPFPTSITQCYNLHR